MNHFRTLRCVRRLFSTFAQGVPGAGLLLLRLALGITLIDHGLSAWLKGAPFMYAILCAVLILLGLLLLVGLWTPIVAGLAAAGIIYEVILGSPFGTQCVSVGFFAVALALLGPGAWSLDGRLYGWQQIEISDRKREQGPPR